MSIFADLNSFIKKRITVLLLPMGHKG